MDPKEKMAFINELNNRNSGSGATNEGEAVESQVPQGEMDTLKETTSSLVIFCSECGHKNSVGSKFCIDCGMPLLEIGESNTTLAQDNEPVRKVGGSQNTGNEVLKRPAKVVITAEKRKPTGRYTSAVINADVLSIIQKVAKNNEALIIAAEKAQTRAALANGLAEWNIEPPVNVVRRRI